MLPMLGLRAQQRGAGPGFYQRLFQDLNPASLPLITLSLLLPLPLLQTYPAVPTHNSPAWASAHAVLVAWATETSPPLCTHMHTTHLHTPWPCTHPQCLHHLASSWFTFKLLSKHRFLQEGATVPEGFVNSGPALCASHSHSTVGFVWPLTWELLKGRQDPV